MIEPRDRNMGQRSRGGIDLNMVLEYLLAGWRAVKEYITAHTVTCLVPAFFLAGGVVSFVNREAILNLLGEKVSKWKSFSLAILSSFVVAACSCTVIPIAAGLYCGGAGIGVAAIILWVAPSSNILSLIYTGNILGANMVLSRLVAAVLMAFVVGATMSFLFSPSSENTIVATPAQRDEIILQRKHLYLLLFVLLSLLLPNYLVKSGAYAYKIGIWAIATLGVAAFSLKTLSSAEFREWMRETWWFVRLIFPLLVVGVFLVGIIREALPAEMVESWLGGNGIRASFFATMIGAVTYFATLTEAPFVDTLLKMGMGKRPALALLLTGPGLSLPNWIATGRVFGARRATAYVVTIVILGTVVGWFWGNFIFQGE